MTIFSDLVSGESGSDPVSASATSSSPARASLAFTNGNIVKYVLYGRSCCVGCSGCPEYTQIGEFTYNGGVREGGSVVNSADRNFAEAVSFPSVADYDEYKWVFLWSSMDTWASDITASAEKGHWWVGC